MCRLLLHFPTRYTPVSGINGPSAFSSLPLVSLASASVIRDSPISHGRLQVPAACILKPAAALSHGSHAPFAHVRRSVTTCSLCASRLLKEYRELLKAGDDKFRRPDGSLNPIQLQPVTPTNLTKWTASILAPPATPYAHHRFTLSLVIPATYPHSPPTVHFVTPIAHPNVHPTSGRNLYRTYSLIRAHSLL